jgi:cyclo(L-tyrosyl-L-tyrosyl) synthase
MIRKLHCSQSNRIYREANHACLGISPFNSYFSMTTIENLAHWADTNFNAFSIFIPDKPTVYTLNALGYSLEKSAKESNKQCRYLKNKIRKALYTIGKTDHEIEAIILDGAKLDENARFQYMHRQILWNFENDATFRADCLEASKWVLASKAKHETQLTEAALLTAVKYFLYEIPIFIDTANIVGENSSLFCYHQVPSFLEKMYRCGFNLKPQCNQGFAELQEVTLT